jgi:IS5 family transposase
MDVIPHTDQRSIEQFHAPFGGKLDPNNRWLLLAKLIPGEPLESLDASLFSAKTGATAKPFPMVLGVV